MFFGLSDKVFVTSAWSFTDFQWRHSE